MSVFAEAFSKGLGVALDAVRDPDAIAAIELTLLVAAIAVPFNAAFGLCAAWAVSKHDFPGKSFLITLIDLPFSVSPVVAGLIYHAGVRRPGLVWRLADRPRHQDHLRPAGHCPGRPSS